MIRSDFTGRTIGNWQLLRLIGEGAFGAVYEAQHQAIAGRRAAIKVLDPQMSVRPDIKRRFVNEANAASRVAQENIVQVFDGGVTEEGTGYVVMELLAGQSLAQLLKRSQLNVGRTLNIGVQAASALQAAHNVGIIHRDLKPDNIYIIARDSNPEFLKVLDFGIAKLRDDGGHTKAGMWMGTPGYMSPEQWQTIPDIDGRSDIYALGIILYECLTGRLPYSGSTPYEWLNAHLNHPIPDPSVLAPMPPLLSQLIQRMLAKRREERPQTMAEVLSDMQRCAVLKTNPWVRMMAEEPGRGGRKSGTIELSAGASGAAVLGHSSTLRQGSVEIQKKSAPSAVPRPRLLGYLLVGMGSAAAGIASFAAVYQLGWLNRLNHPYTNEVQAVGPTVPAPIAASLSAQPPTEHLLANRTEGPAALLEPASPASSVQRPLIETLPPEMAVFGPGRFKMGSGSKKNPDGPAHPAEVKRFALSKFEVTIAEYQAYLTANKLSSFPAWEGTATSKPQDIPVTLINREQAESYCRWRYARWEGRLPTESEWEFAARDGRNTRHYSLSVRRGFHLDKLNAGHAQLQLLPVTSMPEGATAHGLLHVLGNAAEWTSSDGNAYPGSTAVIPAWAVVRGGAANSPLEELRLTLRTFLPAEGRYPFVGFRCAASAK